MAAQAAELGFFTNWSYAHPRAIELAARIASYAPGDLNRVFFTSGGSEAVESALKLVRNYHRVRGDGQRHKVIAREIAYHGTSLGRALAPPASRGCGRRSSRSRPAAATCRTRTSTTGPRAATRCGPRTRSRSGSSSRGPETVGAVILEPVQNAGGCFTPQEGYFQRVREICDRHGVLLISDEVICSWGRLGHWFGCERYGYRPDIVTTAKGLTSAYAPMGAVIVSDAIAEPFMHGTAMFAHGFTFGGHPVAAAAAHGEPRHLRARGHQRPRAREGAGVPRRCSTACATCRSSATSAVPASSRRSSWSRTRRRARASTTRSRSTCCAASSPASSSSRA